MKAIQDLQLGYSDAENYRRRENRSLFNQLFIKNSYLDRLCEPGISFLMGEKGTGKTAYAVFLSNNDHKNTISKLRYVRETDYLKFIELKREKHLALSDYAEIWRIVLLLLMSEQIHESTGGPDLVKRFTKLRLVKEAIDDYYHKAFAPEIVHALDFVQKSAISAGIISKHARVHGEESESISFTESRFQTNLLYIRRKFEAALSQVRPNSNQLIFIDGIDIRPASVPYPEYLECIKGLATAIWQINNDFFPSIKGGAGRLRVVMLIRPDIFQSLGLQNQNTKVKDNTVFLDWRTEYTNHRNSGLFSVIDHLLASQQDVPLSPGDAWDHYFSWNAPSIEQPFNAPTSFLSFLRWSYCRPRDILTMLQLLQEQVRNANVKSDRFDASLFENSTFKRRYSDYLLGELKDHLTFYYSAEEYEIFLKFFEYLNGHHRFSYSEYKKAFAKFRERGVPASMQPPQFMVDERVFLQFLYDLNVICYIETPLDDKPYVRWCFRQRSYANIAPKVKENLKYEIFYGLHKALNVGQTFASQNTPQGNDPSD